jgi:hypothetical protein
MPVYVVIALLAVASVAMWLRGKSWARVLKGPAWHAGLGALVGLVALAIGLLVATPLLQAITDDAIQWSMYPVVRGSSQQALLVAIVVGALALATELVLRGFVVDLLLELRVARYRPVVAIVIGALGDAVLADGGVAARIGAAIFGVALGWMFVASGRSVVAPLCARLAFVLGALALEAAKLVG